MTEKVLYLNRVGVLEDWREYLEWVETQAMERMRPGSKTQVVEAIVDCLKARKDRWNLIREGIKKDYE